MGTFTSLSLSVDIWTVLFIHFLKACPTLTQVFSLKWYGVQDLFPCDTNPQVKLKCCSVPFLFKSC